MSDRRNDHPAQRDEAARAREARAILVRIDQETAPQIGAAAAGMLRSVGGHFCARDADPADRVEVIGTRIGRGLGLLAFVVLALLLLGRLLGP